MATATATTESHVVRVGGLLRSANVSDSRRCIVVFTDERSAVVPAHCLRNADATDLRVSWLAGGQARTTEVRSFHVHDAFEPSTGAWDIAVLMLAEGREGEVARIGPFTSDAVATTYTLGGSNISLLEPSAIGATFERSMVAAGTCDERPTPAHSVLCVRMERGCPGDSGMPLFRADNRIAGILSSGPPAHGCTTGEFHFVNLAAVAPWIRSVTTDRDQTASTWLLAAAVFLVLVLGVIVTWVRRRRTVASL